MSSFPKTKPYQSKQYREFVRTLACVVESPNCKGQIIPHHVTSVGAGGSDLTCIPLCAEHHNEIHSQGKSTFQKNHYVTLWRLQANTLSKYVELLEK